MTAPTQGPEVARARRRPPAPLVLLAAAFLAWLVGASVSSLSAWSEVCFWAAGLAVVASTVVALRQAAPRSPDEAQRMGGVLGALWRMGMRDGAERRPRGPS